MPSPTPTSVAPTRPDSALRHAPFRWLVAGAAVNSLGNGIAPVALAFAVLDLGGDATDLGVVVGLYALADVLMVLFGGVLGDRFERRTVMQLSMVGAGLAQGTAAFLLVTDAATVWLLAGVGMLIGALGALGGPSSAAITPQTVPPGLLRQAVVWRRLAQNTAVILGSGAAGLLVVGVGSGWALAVDAATFLAAAVAFGRVRVPAATEPVAGGSLRRDVAEGFREVVRHTWLWLLLLQAMLYHLFYGGAQGVLGPIVVGDEIGRAAWGYALAAMMTGFVVGGLVTVRWRPRRALHVGTWFLALTAAFPLAIAVSDSLTLVLLGAFLHGFGLEIFSVGWDLSIQENVRPDKLARVYSFDMVGSYVARPVGLALTGPVAEVVGYRAWLAVVAAVIAASVLASLLNHDVRHLERRPEDAEDAEDAGTADAADVTALTLPVAEPQQSLAEPQVNAARPS
ncbi:MFS transporter [Nocardioides sp. SYSU D00038]|uniref:MFS transporter n=1 Tax=Nocardioides sp. SYSU D00038 TaxID=2812554 RepID=UPI00196732E4|nr:MFS transporter [Nocardioides sp. SYSU D00038]